MLDPYSLAYLCTGLIIAIYGGMRMLIRVRDPASVEHKRIIGQLVEMQCRYPLWFVALALTLAIMLAAVIIAISWPTWLLTYHVGKK